MNDQWDWFGCFEPEDGMSCPAKIRIPGGWVAKYLSILPVGRALSRETRRKWKMVQTVLVLDSTRIMHIEDNSETPCTVRQFFISSLALDVDTPYFADHVMNVMSRIRGADKAGAHIDLDFDQDQLPLGNHDYRSNIAYFKQAAHEVLSYAREQFTAAGCKAPSFLDLQMCCCSVETVVNFLRAYLTRDNRSILQDKNPLVEKLLSKKQQGG